MSGPTRPPTGGAPRQPWKPEQAPSGVTCPACGLTNEVNARTCRNCGLPIASADDPVRGVAPGRVDMPAARRSGLSATVGLVLVVGLLLVGGTLAVSGGGILSSGGRLGVDDAATAAPDAGADGGGVQVGGEDPGTDDGADDGAAGRNAVVKRTKFEYTCDDNAITDLSKRKWKIEFFTAGSRISDGYDQVQFQLAPAGGKRARKSTRVEMLWMDPDEARDAYGVPDRIQGKRALVLTFDGQVGLDTNQAVDSLSLEPQQVTQIRNIQTFQGSDDKVHAVIGLRSDSCARLQSRGFKAKDKNKNGRVWLQVERFET